MANLEERYHIQRQALGESTADNPLLPEDGSPAVRKALKNGKKSYNACHQRTARPHPLNPRFHFRQRKLPLKQVIGNIVDHEELLTKLRIVDNNLINAVYKVYSFIVGNPEEPTDISDIGDSVHGAIRSLNNNIGELENSLANGTPKSGNLSYITRR